MSREDTQGYDIVARMDQAMKDAELTARPLIAFHNALVQANIHEMTRHELTRLYAQRILSPPQLR